jgi:hypothetical protein
MAKTTRCRNTISGGGENLGLFYGFVTPVTNRYLGPIVETQIGVEIDRVVDQGQRRRQS